MKCTAAEIRFPFCSYHFATTRARARTTVLTLVNSRNPERAQFTAVPGKFDAAEGKAWI